MRIEFVRENRDIIIGTPYKFIDASKELAEHHLIMDFGVKLTKQSSRFTNPVLVLQKNGTRRMCLDYTALRAAMPFGLHNAAAIYRWQMDNCF